MIVINQKPFNLFPGVLVRFKGRDGTPVQIAGQENTVDFDFIILQHGQIGMHIRSYKTKGSFDGTCEEALFGETIVRIHGTYLENV